MTTKHELIMSYIEKLPVGDKISVRKVAQNMQPIERLKRLKMRDLSAP